MIVTNYLWWANVSCKYEAMVSVHMKQVQWEFKQATHRVHRDTPSPRSKRWQHQEGIQGITTHYPLVCGGTCGTFCTEERKHR